MVNHTKYNKNRIERLRKRIGFTECINQEWKRFLFFRYLNFSLIVILLIFTSGIVKAQELSSKYSEYSYTQFFHLIEQEQDTVFSLKDAIVRFNAETGWYSVTQEKDGKTVSLPVFRYFDDRIEIYRNGKPEYGNETDALIDYVSCGARASFGEMIRMEIPESRMAPYRRGPETY